MIRKQKSFLTWPITTFLHSTLHAKSNSSILRSPIGDPGMRRSTSVVQIWKSGPPVFPDTLPCPALQNKDQEYDNSLQGVDQISDIPNIFRPSCSPWYNLHHPVDAHCAKQDQAPVESVEHNYLTVVNPNLRFLCCGEYWNAKIRDFLNGGNIRLKLLTLDNWNWR